MSLLKIHKTVGLRESLPLQQQSTISEANVNKKSLFWSHFWRL